MQPTRPADLLARRQVRLAKLAPVLAASTGVLVLGTSPSVAARPVPDPTVRALTVLHDWDARRARAWADGDAAGLAGLYLQGSTAGTADVRLLGRYAERGFVVRGLQVQVFSARALVSDPDRVRLRLVDRMAGATAYGRGRCVRVPGERPRLREVELRRQDAGWVLVEQRPG